jgi:hypothetical protein
MDGGTTSGPKLHENRLEERNEGTRGPVRNFQKRVGHCHTKSVSENVRLFKLLFAGL